MATDRLPRPQARLRTHRYRVVPKSAIPEPETVEYLDYRGVSALTGISPRTLKGYLSKARTNRANGVHNLADYPEPDAVFARSPVWKPTTIERWLKRRPGSGTGATEARLRNQREREH